VFAGCAMIAARKLHLCDNDRLLQPALPVVP
jgi:hypothetical protein